MRGAETEPDACAESARSWLRRFRSAFREIDKTTRASPHLAFIKSDLRLFRSGADPSEKHSAPRAE